MEQVYNKVLNASLEVLCEFAINTLLDKPLDRYKWNRKVFKVYKTLNMLEKKKHTKPHFCKRLFKLVFVLYKLQKGELDSEEIWRQLQMQIADDDASQADSSYLGGSGISEGNFTVMTEKIQVQPALSNEKESDSNYYSNFKAENAGLFSLS